MAIFTRGTQIEQYKVQSLIKENLYTETYRVEDEDGNPFFLKAFITKRMPEKLINTETGVVFEIEHSRKMNHKNIISFISNGILDSIEGTCQYYVTNYFNGELLIEKIQREGKLNPDEAELIFVDILDGLHHIHDQRLFHNDITPRNIMLHTVADSSAEIIDLGHMSAQCSGSVPFDTSDLDVFYCANETFCGMYDEQSDIFAATAVLFTMLTGEVPWKMEFSPAMKRARRAMLLKEKRKEEPINFEELEIPDVLKKVLARGLATTAQNRYRNIAQVVDDLNNPEATTPAEEKPENKRGDNKPNHPSSSSQNPNGGQNANNPNFVEFEVKRGNGNGFKDIAGMEELKTYLSQRVIFVIKNKEKVEKYKLSAPNGLLLYGPPGCGKTFVAEKFAEETGFNFIQVKSSDLASSFVHGSQEKIAQLFTQAERNSPVVICFDEFDALVPDRSNPAAQYSAGEVNEFLSQLNNCSQRGIFAIATTNRPDKIDSAVLRTGRIDKQVYVPLPDKEARKKMFMLHLQGRPYDENHIDAEKLADLANGFIASDIAYVVNDAAMIAAFTDQIITHELLETSIKNTHPSLRADTLQMYEEIKQKMENTERRQMQRTPIGFK